MEGKELKVKEKGEGGFENPSLPIRVLFKKQ